MRVPLVSYPVLHVFSLRLGRRRKNVPLHAWATVNRYSAKLLFQFRVDLGCDSAKRRRCEERIIVINALTAVSALGKANRRGRAAVYDYANDEGHTVYFEFIGVMDLLCLGAECDDDEVWYDIRERLLPMERRDVFVPAVSDLNAIRNES